MSSVWTYINIASTDVVTLAIVRGEDDTLFIGWDVGGRQGEESTATPLAGSQAHLAGAFESCSCPY